MKFEAYLVLRKFANLINRLSSQMDEDDRAKSRDHLLQQANIAIRGSGVINTHNENIYDDYYGDLVSLHVAREDSDKTLIWDTENDVAIVDNFEDWYSRWIEEHE